MFKKKKNYKRHYKDHTILKEYPISKYNHLSPNYATILTELLPKIYCKPKTSHKTCNEMSLLKLEINHILFYEEQF